MKITFELLLLFFVLTVFTPALFFVAHATDVGGDPTIEPNLKEDKIPGKTDDNVVNREAAAINPEGFSVVDRSLLRDEEPHQFQAEIPKLMDIIVKSLYSNKDIFIRELVSNAADALSKIRFLSLTNPSLLKDEPNLEIKISSDPEKGILYIRDTGIGMTKKELVNNLGSIAKSGTKEFLEKAAAGQIDAIGQFGVGFYSAFLVADKVTVVSKSPEDDQYIWEGTADSAAAYSVAKDPRGNTLGRGTLIILQLNEESKKYTSIDTVKEITLRFNEFIPYPIYVWNKKETKKEVPIEEVVEEKKEEEKTDEEKKEDIEVKEDEGEEEKEEKPKTKTITETTWDWDRVNIHQPLWTRKRSEIKDEDYVNFYKDVLRDNEEPLYYTHFKAEGDVEFNSLLYIPKTLPFGYWDPGFKAAMKLYVKRVFITEDFNDMLPNYLSFIKGIVDSDDLPLNVSREMLQQNKTLGVIKRKLVRKIIAMFQELAEKAEKAEKSSENSEENSEAAGKWNTFWENFGTNVKLGVVQDTQNKSRLAKLVRFNHAKDPKGKPITFDQYIAKMKKGQEDIYYLGGESKEQVLSSPLLERLLKKGYDVLLLTDPIDEYTISALGKYDGKYSFTDVSKDGLKINEDEEEFKKVQESFQPLCEFLRKKLDEKVSKVEVSKRLTKSPSALVASQWGYSANMERIMRAQALKDERYSMRLGGKRVMEINPRHPIVKKLLEAVNSGNAESDSTIGDVANVLFDTAVLNSGFALNEPAELTSRVVRMAALSLNLDPNEQPEEEVFAEEEEVEEVKDEEKTEGSEGKSEETKQEVNEQPPQVEEIEHEEL